MLSPYRRRRRRHPADRRPLWLRRLDAEVKYWLTASAHRPHSKPFNKTMKGYFRRQQRQFKVAQDKISEI
jgi:ribosomal protein L20